MRTHRAGPAQRGHRLRHGERVGLRKDRAAAADVRRQRAADRPGLGDLGRASVLFSRHPPGLDRLQRFDLGHAQDVDQRFQSDCGGLLGQRGGRVGDVVDGIVVLIWSHTKPPLDGTKISHRIQAEYHA